MNTPANTNDTSSDKLTQAKQIVDAMKSQIGQAVIGQETIIEETLICLLAGGHVLLEGVPGLGKTLLVKALAKTFQGDFRRIQFTPDLMPADVTGHTLFDPATSQFTTRKGPIFTNLLLADEINRAPAKTQSALLEVMQEQQVTIEGQTHALSAPFMVLATQNPLEQEGTYPLPEAQLDRFLLKVIIDYPTEAEEIKLLAQVTKSAANSQLETASVASVIPAKAIQSLQQLTASLTVDEKVVEYATRIIRATRNHPGISVGAGPRGGIALIRCAKAAALLAGRDFVLPDDIKHIALPALRHRIALTPELEIEGQTNDSVLTALLGQIAAPRL